MDHSRHPWHSRAFLLTLVTAAASVLIALGLDAGTVEHWQATALGIVTLAVNAGIVHTGEAKTTPLADPRDNAGRRLTPER